MKKAFFKQDNIINIFFIVTSVGTFAAMLGIILYYVFAFASLYNGSESFNWLLGIFSDFVEIMNISIEESPYVVEGASHPPLAIMILYPFAMICKSVFAKYSGQVLTVDELTSKLTITPQFWIAIILFFVICTISIICLVVKKYDLRKLQIIKIATIIMASAPFVYAVMRGNTIYFALIFLMIFLFFKDSKNVYLRELSYISLAISGCLKIYPLFFGVFLLKDKKIFASARVAIYFFAIFFASFFFFDQALVEAPEFVDSLEGFMTNELRLLGRNNLSISALLFKILWIFNPAITAENTLFSILNIALLAVIFLISTVAAIGTKNNFARMVICSSIVILIPSISYFYVLIFTVLPFLEYTKEADKMPAKKAILYFASFLFLFVTFFVLPKNFIVHSLVVIMFLFMEIIGVFKKEIFVKKKI